jgi:hypothetical protein
VAGDGFNAQHLGHGGITLEPGHAGELVRAGEDAADTAQRDIGGIVRQDFAPLLAKAFLPEKVRPDDEAAVSGEAVPMPAGKVV